MWPWVAATLFVACTGARAADIRLTSDRVRHPDLTPPEIVMEVERADAENEFLVRARVADRSGVAKVFLSVAGDITAGRSHEPYLFRIVLETMPAEVCIVADDRFGNSGRACRLVGRVCLIDGDCAERAMCRLPVGACFGDTEGVCQPRPESCPEEPDPVCGCDEVTYRNFCAALAAGVNVRSRGPCPE
jgi:hypothetical protein